MPAMVSTIPVAHAPLVHMSEVVEYQTLYFCPSSMWVWEKEHCYECVPCKLPRHHLPLREEKPRWSSTAFSAEPGLSKKSEAPTGPKRRRSESPSHRDRAGVPGVCPKEQVSPSNEALLSRKEGQETSRTLWYCASDLYIYDHEHCYHCESFVVDAPSSGAGHTAKSPNSSPAVFGNESRYLASVFAKGVRLPFESIPIINVQPLLDGLPDDDPAVLHTSRSIAMACKTVGFLYVQGHGVPPELMQTMFAQTKKFFAQPLERKLRIAIEKSKAHRGYFPIRGECLSTKGDLKEGLDLGMELADDDPDLLAGTPLHGANEWPRALDSDPDEVDQEFRRVTLEYTDTLVLLAKRILRGFAIGLGLASDFFDVRCTKPMAALRLLHYPPQEPSEVTADSVGCGAHTDYGCCTLLAQDNCGGLQVWSGEKWVAAPPLENTFVVNIGDMMAMWTNDRFPATVHRVVNLSGKDRYSMPFFFNPNYNTEVRALEQCQGEGEAARYPATTCGAHLQHRFDSTFVYRGTP
eukprot:CAMPEP_0114555826 /NCGR_PEP_ID=MMETSP0114-20121206/8958_1 /TAXON_ID=31324 /ORGANISM="Goniomonas sp, Strain m" /LENGTH=520 /DNA_ID=CAMNT_0001740981 /DNA_START=34 /DNA_END=1592 /DNA_ORIENTATION=+